MGHRVACFWLGLALWTMAAIGQGQQSPISTPEVWHAVFLDPPAGLSGRVVPVRIDEAGRVYGWTLVSDGSKRGFLWLPVPAWGLSAGSHDLGPIDSDPEAAIAMNSRRMFAVTRSGNVGPNGAFVALRACVETFDGFGGWPDVAEIAPLDNVAMNQSVASDISDGGSLVGWSEIDPTTPSGDKPVRGFIWSPDGTRIPTHFSGARQLPPVDLLKNSAARGINEYGYVVGSSFDVASERDIWTGTDVAGVASIWISEMGFDLNVFVPQSHAGLLLNTANDINGSNQIVGVATQLNGERRGVLLLPGAQGIFALSSDDLAALGELLSSEDLLLEPNNTLTDMLNRLLGDGPEQMPSPPEDGCLYYVLRGALGLNVSPFASFFDCEEGGETWAEFSRNPNRWHDKFNRSCRGCAGNDPKNPNYPDGAPGWPARVTAPPEANGKGPYFPDGGPGGDGAPGAPGRPNGGNGGSGGEGDAAGNGGKGGNGGPADGDGTGGRGGPGGPGGQDDGTSGSSGGWGGQGGEGGKGSGIGGGGNGGAGGAGGDSNSRGGGIGGSGGNGGNSGGTPSTQASGPGNGGVGGDGGKAGPNRRGGDGGAGGNAGGTGGNRGRGGDGGRPGQGTPSGNGGPGGTGLPGGTNGNFR